MASAIVKDLLDAGIAAVQSPEGQADLTALVTAGEGAIVPALTKALSGLPKPGGIAGIVLPAIESAVSSEVTAVVAKYSASDIVAFLTTETVNELKALGG
ncbi:MAG: hypothetical protein ABR949_10070 [Candidatus Aquilonibacter sp.]|jgi:hypothetical protein